jgi:hypothetical protein
MGNYGPPAPGTADEKAWSTSPAVMDTNDEGKDIGTSGTGGKSVFPVPNGTVTSLFGTRTDPVTGKAGSSHDGIDIAAESGTPILAVKGGTVSYAGPASGFGNMVVIDHPDGTKTRYGHMNNFTVTKGQQVAAGELIAYVGSAGKSTGPHLHLDYFNKDGKRSNPEEILGPLKKGAMGPSSGTSGATPSTPGTVSENMPSPPTTQSASTTTGTNSNNIPGTTGDNSIPAPTTPSATGVTSLSKEENKLKLSKTAVENGKTEIIDNGDGTITKFEPTGFVKTIDKKSGKIIDIYDAGTGKAFDWDKPKDVSPLSTTNNEPLDDKAVREKENAAKMTAQYSSPGLSDNANKISSSVQNSMQPVQAAVTNLSNTISSQNSSNNSSSVNNGAGGIDLFKKDYSELIPILLGPNV